MRLHPEPAIRNVHACARAPGHSLTQGSGCQVEMRSTGDDLFLQPLVKFGEARTVAWQQIQGQL